jgi:hypothetical protein
MIWIGIAIIFVAAVMFAAYGHLAATILTIFALGTIIKLRLS